MSSDLNFITNQPGQTLKDRFHQLIRDAKLFDCLVGYFYISGFHQIKDALKNIEKIRILVGLGLSSEIQFIFKEEDESSDLFSHKQIKEKYFDTIKNEFENTIDAKEIDDGLKDFIDFIKSGKLACKIK